MDNNLSTMQDKANVLSGMRGFLGRVKRRAITLLIIMVAGTLLILMLKAFTGGIQHPVKSNQEMPLSMNEVNPQEFSTGKIRAKVKPSQTRQMKENLTILSEKTREQSELTLHKTPPVNKEDKRITEPVVKTIKDEETVGSADDKKTMSNAITAKATKGILPAKVTDKKPTIKHAQVVEKARQKPNFKINKVRKKSVKKSATRVSALQMKKRVRKPLIDVPPGSDKVKLYISLLKNKTIPWYIRNDAARELGLTGDKRAIVPLIYALQSDAHPYTRREAALSLGKLNDKIALEPLTRATLDDNNEWVSQYAADAIDGLISKKITVRINPSK